MENFINHGNIFNFKNLKRYESPLDFYLTINRGLELSEEAYLSTMYFGDDNKTEIILRILSERNKNNKKTIVILDEARGLSNWMRSKIRKYNLEDQIFAKRMNSSILPRRLSECISVFHSKIIVFDDVIYITGGNMSDDYFYNRLDRHYSIEDHTLAVYLKDRFFNFYVRSSTKINGSNIIPARIKFKIHKENFIYNENQSQAFIYEGKTELTILKLLQTYKFKEIYISTAYLNFPSAYFEILRSLNVKIFVSDPETNKFRNYGIFCGTVTELYKYSILYTKNKLLNAEIYEFKKEGFTMHGKGIWGFSDSFCLTSVGSSNLNRRSYERDNELNVLILTKNKQEISILQKEVKFMIDNSKRRTIGELRSRSYNIFVILLFFILNAIL